MTLDQIIEKFAKLSIYEQRHCADEYHELVFYNREMDVWNNIVTSILDAPIKPAGVRPTKDMLRLTKDYGGIEEDQILFKKEFADFTIMAMFWPWQDDIHTTLKVVLLKR